MLFGHLFSKVLGFLLVAVFFYSLYVKKRGGNKVNSDKFYLNGVYISLVMSFP